MSIEVRLNTKAQVDIAAASFADPQPGDSISIQENLLLLPKGKLDGLWALFEEHARKIRCSVSVKYNPVTMRYVYTFGPRK